MDPSPPLALIMLNEVAVGEQIAYWIHTPQVRVQDPVGTVLSAELSTVDHHDSIKLSVRCCVWKIGEGFPGRVSPNSLKWVAVYSSVTFHING